MIDQNIIDWFVPGDSSIELKHGDHDQSTHGSGSSDDYTKDLQANTDAWRSGKLKPKAWREVEANKGDKFMMIGRDGEAIAQVQVTQADPYRRFPIVKITKVENSNPKDREVADYFFGRESGGEIKLADADISYFKPIRRGRK